MNKAYTLGKQAAFKYFMSKTADFDSGATLGGIAGGTLGASAGALTGNLLGKHIGKETRTRVLGVPLPYTGYGEKLFGTPQGPQTGELLGSMIGGSLGSVAGSAAGSMLTPPKPLRYPMIPDMFAQGY